VADRDGRPLHPSLIDDDNVAIVRAVYEAFGRGDVEAVFAAMIDQIAWDESPGVPYGGRYRGRDEIVEKVFGPILADVEGFTAEPDEILALDEDRVFAQGMHGGRGEGDAVPARRRHQAVL
jgi:ketosteroid isomerase-like protein